MSWVKKSSLTEVQIVTLLGEGYTARDIAAKLCCSKTADNNAIIKFSADTTFKIVLYYDFGKIKAYNLA